ncbi:hypothetical protein [Marilutibacter aestuarii]|uniref:Uncharacterized protein n=1 Tax=Marilutibacter aestuarii TaxID=1706195 RepID=A0A508AU67_9GAMM|nr:hypothetical protein [Lysobacter aestuarii]TQD51238.1 hypothetical protein FKV25_02060 [Lysobacter aestuarii]
MTRRDNIRFELQGELAAVRNAQALGAQLPYVQDRAIATLKRRLPVFARRDIQAEYNLKAGRINQDLIVRGDGNGISLSGRWGRGIGLLNFGARQVRKGVTAAIFRGKRELHQGAFKARLLSGNTQIVTRSGAPRPMTAGRYKGKRREPLAVEYGATIAQALAKGRRPERIADFARGVLAAEVERLRESYERRGRKSASG